MEAGDVAVVEECRNPAAAPMAGHSGGPQTMDVDNGPSTWRPSSPSAPPAKHRRVHGDEAEPELHRNREGSIVHILSDSSESSDCVVVEQRVRGAADGSTGSRPSSEPPAGRASDEPLPRRLAASSGAQMQQMDAHSGPEGEGVRDEKGARPQASSGVLLGADAAMAAAAAAGQQEGEEAIQAMGMESGSPGRGSGEEGVQQTHTDASPCEGPGHGVLTAAQGVAASLPAPAAEPHTANATSQHQESSLAPAAAARPITGSGSTAQEGDVSNRLQGCVAEQQRARGAEREEMREPLLRALATGPSEFWAASMEMSRKLEQAAAVAGAPPEVSEASDASERAAVPLREAVSSPECAGRAPAPGMVGSGSPAPARGAASSIGDRSRREAGGPPPRGVAQIPTVELLDGSVYPSPRQQSELLQQLAAADFNYDPHSRELRHRFLPVYRRLFRELNDRGTSKPDMQAFSKVVGGTADPEDRNAFMDQNRARYGHPRGVRVGEKFSGRVELAVLGIHCMPVSGMDWRRLSNAGFPPALDAVVQRSLKDAPEPPGGDATNSRMAPVFAICLAGQYVDDKDDGSSFEYTGMGGRRKNSKIQTEDQGWDRGNQGLWWNHQLGLPVRVARLFGDSSDERNSRTYVYEGLYYVAGAWEAASAHNSRKVVKFRMVGVPRHHTNSVHVQWNQQALKKRFITQRLIAAPAGREEEEEDEEEEEEDDDDDEDAELKQEEEELGGKRGRGRIAAAASAQGQELRGGAGAFWAQQQSQAKAAGQQPPQARRGRPPANRPKGMVWGYAAPPAALQQLLLERVQHLQTLPHLLSADISNGSEIIPIPAFNEFDDEPLPDFQYIASHEQRQPRFLSDAARELLGQVAEKQLEVWGCAGRFRSRKVPWYSKRNGLMQETHWRGVPECRAGCQAQGCPGTHVVSAGLRYPLEVFKTPNGRGWGVRCSAEIPVGAFIGVTYTGRVITDREAEQLEGCDRYFFGLDHFTSLYHEGHIVLDTGKLTPEAQLEDSKPCAFRLVPPMPTRLNWPSLFYGLGAGDSVEDLDINHLVLDASGMGSAARFLNHSCNPNLVQQPVLLEGDSAFFYHVAFFAAKLIPPGEELTYDYGYKEGLAGSVAVKCLCGAAECRGRLL